MTPQATGNAILLYGIFPYSIYIRKIWVDIPARMSPYTCYHKYQVIYSMKAKVTLNCPAILIKHIQKNYKFKFSIVIPKCLFSRDIIIIVLPLPGAVTITTYLLIGHYKYWTPVPGPLLVISSSSRVHLC